MTRRSLIIGCAIVWGLWLAPPAGAHPRQCLPASPDEPVPLDVECHEHNPATGVGARTSPATLHMNTWTQGTLIEHHEDSYGVPEQKYYYVLDIPSAGILKAELRGDVTRTEPFISKAEYDGEIPETTQAEYSVGMGPAGVRVPAGPRYVTVLGSYELLTNCRVGAQSECSRAFRIRVWMGDAPPEPDPGNPQPPTPEPDPEERQATLLNLSPWQAWVHLYCQKARPAPDAAPVAPCTVTFQCNGMDGEPATWAVEVGPKTIFSYWPGKTAGDGSSANLQAALMTAGKTEEEARRRTTCEIFSPDPLAVRGYTRFGTETLIPVAVY